MFTVTLHNIFSLRNNLFSKFSKIKLDTDNRLPVTPHFLNQEWCSHSHLIRYLLLIAHCFMQCTFLAFSASLRLGDNTKTARDNLYFLLIKRFFFSWKPLRGTSIEFTIPHFKHSNHSSTLQIRTYA